MAIEDLAILLSGGGYEKPNFAESDPYANIAPIGDALTGQILAGRNNFGTKDSIIGSLVTGLLSGAGSGLSANYQTGVKDDYNKSMASLLMGDSSNAAGLPSALFNTAKSNASLFNVSNKLQNDQLDLASDRDIKKEAAKAVLNNPALLKRNPEVYGKLLGIELENAPEPIATKVDGPINPLANGQDSSAEKLKQYFADFSQTMPEVQAAAAARDQLKGEIAANTKTYDEAKAARDFGQGLLQMANTGRAGMSQAGQTGSKIGSWYEKAVSTLAPWDTPEADAQSTGDALINSVAPDVIKMARPVGGGATSDFEAKAYLGSGLSTSNTPEQNAALAGRIEKLGKLNVDYADFLDAYRQANAGSMTGAGQKWNEYKQAFPIFDQKTGEINEARPAWQEFFAGAGAGQSAPTGSTQPTEESVPAGYELTGKTDANGNKGIRKIR